MIFRRIGRAIGRAVRRVVRVGTSIFKGVVRGVTGLASGFMGMAANVLRKFPFLGAMAAFGGFLALPFALMSPHVLGAMSALFGGCQSSSQMASACRQIAASPAYCGCPAAPYNVAHMVAYRHAQIAFQQQYRASMASMGYG